MKTTATFLSRRKFAKLVLLSVTSGIFGSGSFAFAAEDKPTDEENKFLKLILTESYADGGYTVVNPESVLCDEPIKNEVDTAKSISYVTKGLSGHGSAVAGLVKRLYKRNQKQVKMTIKSSPADGYVVDYDHKFSKYFGKDGGGWEKWYKENPKANGNTTVSLPVYDEKSGLLLVYKGKQYHWLAGSGAIILYNYEKDKFHELKRVQLWIS